MSESIEKRVTDILHFLERITGCQLKDLEGKSSFKGTIGAYIEAKDLFTINGFILSGEPYVPPRGPSVGFLKVSPSPLGKSL